MSCVFRKRINSILVYCLALGLSSLAFAETEICPVDTLPSSVPINDSMPASCDSANWEKAATFVRQKITLMKIASSKADFKNMSNYRRDVESVLTLCGRASGKVSADEMVNRVCDTDCHIQRATASLFNVSELPFLDSNGTSLKVMSANVLQEANFGLEIVNRALQNLATGDRGGVDAPSGSSMSPSFNSFLQDNARLQALKARLQIAIGDNYYKNVSRTRAATLKKRAQDALGTVPGQQKPGEETDFAEVYYEQASWTLQEALIDIPQINADGTAGVGDGKSMVADFGRLQYELEDLKNDVEQRLSSINKGFLFLNIDPEAFTSLKTDILQALLEKQMGELYALEEKISDIVVTWQDKSTEEERRKLDSARMRDDRSLELKGIQISAFEDYATEVTQKFQNLIAQNGFDISDSDGRVEIIEREAMAAKLRFELAKLTAEVKNQIEMVKGQSEIDLTVLAREGHQEQRDQYKWLIDVKLTAMNLNLQINDYASQVEDFGDQIKVKESDKKSLKASRDSRTALIEVENHRITEYQEMIAKLNDQRTVVFEAQKAPIQYQICALAAEHAKYFGNTPDGATGCPRVVVPVPTADYWKSLRALRIEMANKEFDYYNKLRACMGGKGQCGDLPDSTQKLVMDAYNTEKFLYETLLTEDLRAMEKHVNDMIDALKQTQNNMFAARIALIATNATVGGAYTVASGFSLSPISAVAEAAYITIMSTAQSIVDNTAANADYSQQIKALELQKAQLIKELRVAWSAHEKEKIIANQALAAIIGQDLQLEHDNLILKADISEKVLTAENAVAELEAERPRLLAQISSLKAERDKLSAENNLLNYEINRANSQIKAAQAQILSLQFEITGLDANMEAIDKDVNRLDKLADHATEQGQLVRDTQSEVQKLNNSVDLQTSIIAELYKKQEQKMTALTLKQIDQLNQVLKLDETRIEIALQYVDKTIKENLLKLKLIDQAKTYTAGLNQELGKVYAQIKGKRCEILQFAANRPQPGQGQPQLFIASEEIISNLTKGIPQYIQAKKTRLEYINYLYNLYRNRTDLFSDMVGREVDTNYSFIQTGDDLKKAMGTKCAKNTVSIGSWVCSAGSLLLSSRQIPVLAHKFIIPSDSGFMSRLLNKGAVRFEITPSALQGMGEGTNSVAEIDAALARKGYFQLWSPSMSSMYNMSVVNLALMADFGNSQCRNSIALNLKHLGFGARYLPVSNDLSAGFFPALAMTEARTAAPVVWDATENASFEHHFRNFFESYMINDFPEEWSAHQGSGEPKLALNFLGAPLVGTYELSIDAKDKFVRSCLEGRTLNIGVAYTKPMLNL